ncbi:MAG: nicotinate-nucleotide adenylyltransferase [Deltaproteobacteria bacterium]|nr:nicotinate-nucleotide adenylyltransferase [Deltaproteobacteria bacterium]
MKREGGKKRIGLFGGTYNPIHFGHLRGAEEIREAFHLDEVVFIPSATPPHKATDAIIDAKHRMEMVKLAIASNPYFSMSEIELSRQGKSYLIDTLRHFCEGRADIFFFILGGDAFVEIETWKDFQNLFTLCHFVVMARPGFQKTPVASQLPDSLTSAFQYDIETKVWVHLSGYHLHFQEISFLDISSTKVREFIEKGESVRYLIPPETEAYIYKHGLYREKR